jgi:S1-C subfamily serine protease
MNATLRVLSGPLAGHEFQLSRTGLSIGRAANADLRFDARLDDEVSALHARLAFERDQWVLHDTNSLNGTFVNGRRIDGLSALRHGDRVRFGANGPEAEFRLADPSTHNRSPSTPTEQIRVEVARQSRRWLTIMLAIVVLLITAFTVLLQRERGRRNSLQTDRQVLLLRLDSALKAGDSVAAAIHSDQQGLADALNRSQEQLRAISRQLKQTKAAADSAGVGALNAQAHAVLGDLSRQKAAAELDTEGIRRRNQSAVARVYAELPDGSAATGSAFAVRADATLITTAHVVADETGKPRLRIGVQFSNSDQVWPARILLLDSAFDLAIIKVDAIDGSVPTVQSLNTRPDTLRPLSPLLFIGFSEGGLQRPSDRAGRTIAVPILAAGTLSSITSSQLEMHAYGGVGSSGSPIFDRRGEVVGIVFGGKDDAGGHVLAGISSGIAWQMLQRLQPLAR